MRRVTLTDLDLDSLASAVDFGTYARGTEYHRRGTVLQTWWDDSDDSLNGVVRGSSAHSYVTAAYFRRVGRKLEFDSGECSCPVGHDCKHVVALVLKVAGGLPLPAAPVGQASRIGGGRPAWQQSLDSLLAATAQADNAWSVTTPLAIELSLVPVRQRTNANPRYRTQRTAEPGDPQVKLNARLVQPGKNGGWVAGQLSWSKLDSLRYQGSYRAAQVRLLTELYALYRSRSGGHGYYYSSYGDERSIELTAFGSSQLWPLLDEAAATGIRVRQRKLGDVDWQARAEFCLNVAARGPDGALEVSPVLRTENRYGGSSDDATPVAFIGADGHGAVLVTLPESQRGPDPGSWPFQLARLASPVPPQLQSMALVGQRLEIPAAELASFRDSYYPRLRRAATVISSDGSFTPPEISAPTLVLRAAYRPAHRLDLDWEWAYQVGETRLTAQPGVADDAGYRDHEAEQAVLAGLQPALDRCGLRAGVGPVRLDGIDTMRFSTELLPLLARQDGLAVEVTGERADYHEATDSLRIGVSTQEQAGDTDWFDLGITVTVDGQPVPFMDLFLALSRGEPHMLLDSGAYFSLDKPELRALARLIDEARSLTDAPPGQLKISRFQAGLWAELAELGVVNQQAAAWRKQVSGLLSLQEIGPRPVPEALAASLRPYQVDGFSWLMFLWEHKMGGILADDMGLGKTLQSLALICHARQAEPDAPPFLIVAPTSVVANWHAEAQRFTPSLNVVSVTETLARRGQALGEVIAGADAVVTSYALLRLDFAAYAEPTWAGLILDEAQFAKNHQAKIYQCARRLPAPFKIAITGTPMENNLMELWSLLSITAPGMFPNPVKFRDFYATPIERRGDAELLAQFRRRIKPLVKRRTKDQVAADLPPKQEQVLEVELHPRHRTIYQRHLQRERQKVLGLIQDMNANRFTILRSLTLLRQLSLHPGLIDDAHAALPSSKLDLLAEQLSDVIGGGHRALVFSQFTGFLAKVRERLEADGVPYCYLDGSTTRRGDVLATFTSRPVPVFLISLKAGGFGLNLTEADYCFLLDPWWNPATEAQAVDRTHRIGQTRTVMVYRLIAADTIEQKVMALKERKARLFASVLDEGNLFGSTLDADDIRELFAL